MKELLSNVLLVVGLLGALTSAQRFDKAASDQARAFLNGLFSSDAGYSQEASIEDDLLRVLQDEMTADGPDSNYEPETASQNLDYAFEEPKADKKAHQAADEPQGSTSVTSDKFMLNDEGDNYMFIEVAQKFRNDGEAISVLWYLANALALRYDSFKNISVHGDRVFFKVKNFDSLQTKDFFIRQISKHAAEIDKQLHVSIKQSGIVKSGDGVVVRKLVEARERFYVVAIVVVCGVIVTLILFILTLVVVKRQRFAKEKRQLNNTSFKSFTTAFSNVKLFGNSNAGGIDESSLVGNNDSQKPAFLRVFWPFRKKDSQASKMNLTEDVDSGEEHREYETDSIRIEPEQKTRQCAEDTISTASSSAANTPISRTKYSEARAGDSNRSSTSSWRVKSNVFMSEEPISTVNMDITTGHVIMNYMEEHLNDKSRIGNEWQALCGYSPEQSSTTVSNLPANVSKNRYSNALPYDHSRVVLNDSDSDSDSDYINASAIIDHDPKNAAYIATQGPLVHTSKDFWQMVWEQSSLVVVSLCKPSEYGVMKCNQYWPSSGCEVYEKFEVNLVSEHLLCEDYLVRSFYLRNIRTNETRTVTQFHFLSWQEADTPQSAKSVLEFRRKVNKSYKSKAPITVHCNDGVGRTGTYILIDMVLSRIEKGAKEIDIAATLEFLRDQRPMVRTQDQFEFAFAVITEELQNMLAKVLAQ